VAELGGGLLAQMRGPFGLDLGLGLPGDLDRGPAAQLSGPGVRELSAVGVDQQAAEDLA